MFSCVPPAIFFFQQAIPPVVGLMKDPSVVVRDSVAWLLCQIMLETPEAVIPNTARDIPPEYLREVCSALHGALADQPRVAIQGCHVSSPILLRT